MEARLCGYEYKTIDDYFATPEGSHIELIDGFFYDMASPNTRHQSLVVELVTIINTYIKSKKGNCRVFTGPFSVVLNKDEDTVVEPDISVICDPSKINDRGCMGAPDWVIEVISPSDPAHDYIVKLKKYLNAGVREYWIVDPASEMITVYTQNNTSGFPAVYTFKDKVPAGIYDDLSIDFSGIE